MIIGPHTETIRHQRDKGWSAIQTHYGNPKSLAINPGYIDEEYDWPIWIWHAAFVASANPKPQYEEETYYYLDAVIRQAKEMKIHSIVLHTGAVIGRFYNEILEGINKFLGQWPDDDRKMIAIELGASVCWFHQNPELLAEQQSWCLDLAHAYAAGIPWPRLQRAIERFPPRVCHANYPGSPFGSGRDIHGWRSDPIITNNKGFDDTIKLLSSLKVPLIVEGSKFTTSTIDKEIEFLRDLVQ